MRIPAFMFAAALAAGIASAQSPLSETSPVANSTASSVTSLTVTGYSCPAGSTVVAFGRAATSGTTFTMSDSQGDTFIPVGSVYGYSYGNQPMQGFYAPNIATTISNGSVTLTLSRSDNTVVVAARCWTGLGSNVVLDTQASGTYTQKGNSVSGSSTTFGFSQVFPTEQIYEGTAFLVIGNASADVFTASNGWSITNQSSTVQFAAGSQLFTTQQTAAQVSVTSSVSDYGGVVAFSLHAYVAPPPFAVKLVPANTLWSTPQIPGLNWAQEYGANYGTGQIPKNILFPDNPEMEGYIQSEIVTLYGGSTTLAITNNQYDQMPVNFWQNGKYTVLYAQNAAAQGCKGTITASLKGDDHANVVSATYSDPVATYTNNAAVDYQVGQTIQLSNLTPSGYNVTGTVASVSGNSWTMNIGSGLALSASTGSGFAGRLGSYSLGTTCGAVLLAGDQIGITQTGVEPGISGSQNFLSYATFTLSNGATAAFVTDDVPPSSNGTHSLQVNATAASNSAATFVYAADATVSGEGNSVLMNGGQWTLQVQAKAKTGSSCAVSFSVLRYGSSGFTSGSNAITPNATGGLGWSTLAFNFTPAETPSTPTGQINASVTTSGQCDFRFKNISLSQTTGTDSTNTTAFRDAVITAARTYHPGTLRYWDSQPGETLDNWIIPLDGAQRSGYTPRNTPQYFSNNETIRLQDFLNTCVLLGADPWIVIPTWWDTARAGNFIDYLAGDNTTTYGAKRIAYGQTAPWTSLFNKLHLELGNEVWNSTFTGDNMPFDLVAYGHLAAATFGAMKAKPSYVTSKFDLVLGCQEGNNGTCMTAHQEDTTGHDSITISGYNGGLVTKYDATDVFSSKFGEAWGYNSDPNNGYGKTLINQIAASGRVVPIGRYEYGISDQQYFSQSPYTVTQANMVSLVGGLGGALSEVIGELEFLRLYNRPQQKWNLAQFSDSSVTYTANNTGAPISGGNIPLWGIALDFGGATNRRRVQFFAHEMVNNAIIGPMFEVDVTSDPTYTSVAQNGLSSYPNVPVVLAYGFMSGTQRSVVLVNSSTTNSQTFQWGGLAPLGSGTQTLLTSTNIDDTNENSLVVQPVTSSINFGSSYTLPPFSLAVVSFASAVTTGYPVQLTGAFTISGNGSVQ